jgi:hypothetical protein
MHPLDFHFRRTLPAALAAIVATAAAVGWITQPRIFRRGYAPAQPIPFSHETHAGTLAIHCAYCHPGARVSPVAGLPEADLCMGCHRAALVDDPRIRQLAAAAARGEALPWKRIHALPSHAFFDHRPHVRAGFACQDCHGEVQDMRVTERRMNLRMGACLDCHRNPGRPQRGPEHCSACHR